MDRGQETVRVPASALGIRRAAEALHAFAAAHGLSSSARWPVQVALDEVLSNVVHHGYGDGQAAGAIEVSFRLEGSELEVTVLDEAPPFDPASAPRPDTTRPVAERAVGGLGLALVRRLMDEVEYARVGGRNRLALRKRVGP